MRGILLLLLLASSAINSFAQSKTNRFIDLDAVEALFFKKFSEAPDFGGGRDFAPPKLELPTGELTLNGALYYVLPPELIGLETQPIAYLSPSSRRIVNKLDLSNATARKRIQTRPLTAFEIVAVDQLKAGTNRVSEIQPGRQISKTVSQPDLLMVLAPIHAKADCAKCHKCEEGKLLGAFSYALARVDPSGESPKAVPTTTQPSKVPIASSDTPTNTVKGLAIAAMPVR